jgi:hypothetical protein
VNTLVNKNNYRDLLVVKTATDINPIIAHETIEFLINIGIPHTILDKYIVVDGWELLENEYLIISKSKFNATFLCVHISDSQKVVIYSDTFGSPSFVNSNLHCLLETLYTYHIFKSEIKIPEIYGEYYSNCEVYATELRKRIESVDTDAIKNGLWKSILDEMELGVI